MRVRRTSAEDWEAFREIRLLGLRSDPEAFGSNHARELAFDEETWRRRAGGGDGAVTSACFFGEVDGVVRGLAGGIIEGTDRGEGGAVQLVSMWVMPESRGSGLARLLVEAVCGWAAERGKGRVRLWVTSGNARAAGLYRKCGFSDTGERQMMPERPAVCEVTMERCLTG